MIKNVKSAGQAGFTLIELVVVIVVLGILAATALPKVTKMGGEARVGVMYGVQGAINSAAQIAHAKNLATGSDTYPSTTDIVGLVSIPADVTATGGVFSHGGAEDSTKCKVTYDATTGTTTTDVSKC